METWPKLDQNESKFKFWDFVTKPKTWYLLVCRNVLCSRQVTIKSHYFAKMYVLEK